MTTVNNMCKGCRKYKNGCQGCQDAHITGCIYREGININYKGHTIEELFQGVYTVTHKKHNDFFFSIEDAKKFIDTF